MTSQSRHRARGFTTPRHPSRKVISSGWPSSGYKISWGGRRPPAILPGSDPVARHDPDRSQDGEVLHLFQNVLLFA